LRGGTDLLKKGTVARPEGKKLRNLYLAKRGTGQPSVAHLAKRSKGGGGRSSRK